VFLDRARRKDQRIRDRGVVLSLGHLPEDFTLTRRKLRQGRTRRPRPCANQRFDNLGIDDRAAARDFADRADELLGILYAFF
jgi:hypothetical protein